MSHRQFFYRLDIFWTIVILTVISILISVLGTALVLYLTGASSGWGVGLTIAAIMPLIIAPIMSSLLLKLMIQLDQEKKEKAQLVTELQETLANLKMLTGLIPICASCKKIRDGLGVWQHLEVYIHEHSEATLSHGYCPDCAQELQAEIEAIKQRVPKNAQTVS